MLQVAALTSHYGRIQALAGIDLALERGAHGTLKDAVAYCEQSGDYVSREIFVDILDDTEEHIDWIETQKDLIDKIGLQNYLQSQMGND